MGSGRVFKIGPTNFIGNLLLGELTLIFTDKTNLRNSPNTRSNIIHAILIFHATHMRGSKAALVVSSARQCWPADNITGSINMWNRCLVVFVNLYLTARIRFQANIFEAHIPSVTTTPIAPQQGFSMNTFARLKLKGHAILTCSDTCVLFVVAHHNVEVT